MPLETKIDFSILDIQGDGLHILLKAKIGRKFANLLIDTGASRTVFDKDRIQHYISESSFQPLNRLSAGLGTNTLEGSVIVLPRLKLGELVITNYTAAVLDLQHVNDSYKSMGLSVIDGVLGSDLLFLYNAVIDYKKRILTLTF
jgi:hypothetical protein